MYISALALKKSLNQRKKKKLYLFFDYSKIIQLGTFFYLTSRQKSLEIYISFLGHLKDTIRTDISKSSVLFF